MVPGRFEGTIGSFTRGREEARFATSTASAPRRMRAFTVRPSVAARAFSRRYMASGMSIVVRMTTTLPYLWLSNHRLEHRTVPYTFLGPADYVSHQGERPIQFVWRLRRPMPADFFSEAKVVGG